MRDWRLAMGFVALVFAVILALRGPVVRGRRAAWLLIGTFVLSYAGWVTLFGIYRYWSSWNCSPPSSL
jgi:hypothetical protein